MLFRRLNLGSQYASSPEVPSILWLAAALLVAWIRPPPTEGSSIILTELFCWLWVFTLFELLPATGVPWDFLRTAAATNSKFRLVAAALGISFSALGASLDDCRWIEVSWLFSPVVTSGVSLFANQHLIARASAGPHTCHRARPPALMA